ncbi:MAG: DNA-directed RNA polymerase subunit alpha [Chloroflexota bacterium]|nr:DNA-directed RNA polymerase subunit alpha [Chloroflexota bacterium]MYC07765.1 DNA-directed RNA polymerase subunit alpha [Chloroflexota bacterium]
MVLDYTFALSDIQEEEEIEITTEINQIESADRYGKFAIEPLEPGFGMTLGNPLRRVLYGSLTGTAITWIKIEDVLHEYATIPHMKEEVSEFLLNVKGIRLRSETDRPGKLRLEVAGEGEVCAADIMASSNFEVVNPELHLATLDSPEAKLAVEFNVEQGVGYKEATSGSDQVIGTLPVDAVFTPIRKVNYRVEPTRVGQRTDYERLVIEVWTDGTVEPLDALRQSGEVLMNKFFLFAKVQMDSSEAGSPVLIPSISPEKYNVTVETLQLSSRTLNCLKRAGIDKVGEVLEKSKEELIAIRNFGEKSYAELFDQLRAMDLLPENLDPQNIEEDEEQAVAAVEE